MCLSYASVAKRRVLFFNNSQFYKETDILVKIVIKRHVSVVLAKTEEIVT